ncbi:DUF4329 domain-containing protein [Ketogulonicigenium vulgare]|uniref:DUF4329 domain-containing protein n=1 Tax=Ketogulonicigenium vulgare (strain WSH-001) TaxID=759362 RepID=F9Y7L1_KETVW|nr:DUF4329 domain-containing protein [Ketogulonicigenium vulgare]ADO41318.1 conserved hypothetical protein [Ketogulonicigenium vulgare Y25]AEM42307.1 hypothetical protein KVU_2468 [Ketogulonicigenium vulgare WSH-001]ALJ79924.1 hypothetical protein KVH_01180 [Ketogulonicigenium vulgare]ANW32818.1 hypothetical protein KvSKV_01185 [Ketogulonicigenium vulgare]AOZ53144.1 hypothetical protein KVC_0117 [Ketogulonicigenium vulgare]
MRRILGILFAVAAITGGADRLSAQTQEEFDFVQELLGELQHISFQRGAEYCGFVGIDHTGKLVASEATRGTMASCPLHVPPRSEMTIIASYHTHGAFDEGFINEIPSDIDMRSDQSMGIRGWVSTPGGRLWLVDSRKMVTRQVCAQGCLPIDPNYYKAQAGDVAKTYTYDELVERLQDW